MHDDRHGNVGDIEETRISRRTLLRAGACAACGGLLGAAGHTLGAPPAASSEALTLPRIGQVRPVASAAIQASPLGVGFEVLDRRLFDPARCYPHLAQLGVKWARCQTGWARTETVRGQYDFRWLDEVVDSLRKIGIQPWFNLGYGNPLYQPECQDPAAVGWIPLAGQARDAWLAFTRAAAQHFKDRVRHWEMWNEPNITGFWKPGKPDAAAYAEFVAATAGEIRRIVPQAVIIGVALAGMRIRYVEQCLDHGLAEHVDKISFHPYRATPEEGYAADVNSLRKLIARHRPGIALWQGECGCPSEAGGAGALAKLAWNETLQAKWVLRRILSDLGQDLELISYYHTVDLVGYRGTTNFKGLLHGTTYTPKLAFFAYQNLCALFDSATRHAELNVKLEGAAADGACCSTFVRAGRPICAFWQPGNLMKREPPKTVDLRLTAGDVNLQRPVVIDPLTGGVHQPPTARPAGKVWQFRGLPLLDHPLLLADQGTLAAETKR